eukprot:CAMPEP_0170813710 /NCGR_PEP_ID=MMETSP0733-20121128/37063_1 /TAXON_ID=186038 /ORGANISM="Fragilariopsis kerguelensis, Strain L26-C5" /LENGTH=55 /DNA_ID=CAMNT_0011171205 /DNA_START=248 /DNA_END=412 /DNA_ORIENTATION=-
MTFFTDDGWTGISINVDLFFLFHSMECPIKGATNKDVNFDDIDDDDDVVVVAVAT